MNAAGTYPWVTATRPVATEEQLSADFRKKLEEWKLKKGIRQPPPVPARQDLSDDFLKRWGKLGHFILVFNLSQKYTVLDTNKQQYIICGVSHSSIFNVAY